jgi:hypothetical protein
MSAPYDPNQSYSAHDNPGYPGPPPYQGQLYPGQLYPGQPYPGQPCPGQPYQAQPYQTPGPPVGPYVAPMYSVYPDPGLTTGGRPGQAVAAAVLSYVEAGLLILTGLILFSGSSAASDWSSRNGDDYGWGTQFALAGLGDLVAAGLLIAGGIICTSGKRLGRTLLGAGLAVCVVEAIFWMIRLNDDSGAIFPWAFFYLVLPILATSMSFAGSVSRWLAHGRQ